MDRRSVWRILGIDATADAREIRRAYARKLKVTNPEDDAQGFQELRAAYEYALQLAANGPPGRPDDEADDARGDDDSSNHSPEPARMPAASAREADALMSEAGVLFDALVAALRRDPGSFDVDVLQSAFRDLMRSPALERVDLYQRAEVALADVLVNHIPRADPLIAAAVKEFGWDQRLDDRSVPEAARGVLARLRDLEYLQSLPKVDPAGARAHRFLLEEKPGRRTWLIASMSQECAELRMLKTLREEYPNLHAQIPRETIAWWQEFEHQPRPSRIVIGVGFGASLVMSTLYMGMAEGGMLFPGILLVFLAGMTATIAVAAFKIYAIEWPVLRVQQRWHGDPPPKFSVGWLALGLIVVFEAGAVGAPSLFGWLVAAAGATTCLWSVYFASSTPAPRLKSEIAATDLGNAAIYNAVVVWWLATLDGTPGQLSWLGFTAVAFVLLASGFGRKTLLIQFQKRLDWQQRLMACLAGLLVTGAAIAFTVLYGRHDAVKHWVVAVAIGITLLRRALPHGITLGGKWYIAFIVLIVGYGFGAYLMQRFDLDPSALEYPGPRPTIPGALTLLMGAVYAFGRESVELILQRLRGRPAPNLA